MKPFEYKKHATIQILMLAMDINQQSDIAVNVYYNGTIFDELIVYVRGKDQVSATMFSTEFAPECLVLGSDSTAEQIIDVLQQIKLSCEAGRMEVAA
ncbi:hypothetical protein [Endozoicomonas sp. SCSIO W0465]|uniref:hypothetical protein n=1 Tax=Endozoicomonas sp. SCSIO W0465 TaxID=2918516 RepID=UPI002074C66A|nr:hypothetical protein [Endozoicomonas sp. SCSIO W0465]USE39206.1 hypothetical protein MJO57_14235 [Endozoicomonas sp. SCSIO W0465]